MSHVLLLQSEARQLPLQDQSVQCIVTSPPYWSLRDYNTPGQLGLEAAHDCLGWATGAACGACYVCHMVQVFRDVWRILRKDGCLFLNLGDSFFSGSGKANNAHKRKYWGGLACDTSGKAPANYRDDGLSSNDLCDGCREVLILRTSRTDTQPAHESIACADGPNQDHKALHCSSPHSEDLTVQLLSEQSCLAKPALEPDHYHAGVQPPVSPESMTPQSLQPPLAVCSHCANCDACLSVLRSPLRDAQLCVRRKDAPCVVRSEPHVSLESVESQENTPGTEGIVDASASRILGTASGLSYLYSTIQRHHNQLKPKDLCGLPWRVALALQADGWILRSEIIWHKLNPMPEAVQDRPTKAHEQVFLFAKQGRYFWDQEAVREAYQGVMYPGRDNGAITNGDRNDNGKTCGMSNPAGRNLRSVWSLATEPYSGKHFATFPQALVERCIQAGTSQAGCCAACGTAWVRQVERCFRPEPQRSVDKLARGSGPKGLDQNRHDFDLPRGYVDTTTTGFAPACACAAGPPVPCVVYDPFVGSGTVPLVARALGRHGLGSDLSYAYLHDQARPRLQLDALAAWAGTNGHAKPVDYTTLPLFAPP